MKWISLIVLAVGLTAALIAQASVNENSAFQKLKSCSIEPGPVRGCFSHLGYDDGCSVSCSGKREAICRDATGFEIPDPMGRPTNCQVSPSSCYCR